MTKNNPSTWIYTLNCPDSSGIVYRVTGLISRFHGMIEEAREFNNPDSHLFFTRIQFTVEATPAMRAEFKALGEELSAQWNLYPAHQAVQTLLMVSKEAHCLNDLLFRHHSGSLPIEIPAIVSNHPHLKELAQFYHVPFYHLPITPTTKKEAERELRKLMTAENIELIVLARYMQILSADLCRDMQGNIINIHHSFLPSFKGAKPYKQAYERGVKMIGATAHYVTSDLDEGPIIEQGIQRVDHSAGVHKLVELGKDMEALTLSRAVKLHAERRILLDGHRTVVFN